MKLQRKSAASGGATTAPPVVHAVLRSPGQPLDAATRIFMEPRFGRDFGDVRVRSDSVAAASARAVGARAYTVGSSIAFSDGEYRPGAELGRRLLAHELAHVVQQGDQQRTPGGNTLPARLQRKTAEETDDEALVEAYLTPHIGLVGLEPPDIKGLARLLNNSLRGHGFEYVRRIFGHIPSGLEDDVASEMVSHIDDRALHAYAAGEEGRKTLNVLYKAMITGSVSDVERKESTRIRDSMPKGDFSAETRKPIVVYPIRQQGFLRDCYSAFSAILLPTGKVRVEFTSVRIWQCDMFRREVATFAPYGGVSETHRVRSR